MKIGSAIFFLDNKIDITITVQLVIKSSQGPDYVKAACMGRLISTSYLEREMWIIQRAWK